MMTKFLNDKVIPRMMDFINTKSMIALKNGLLYAMPMVMVGAIFLLLANFPIPGAARLLEVTGITPICNQAADATFSLISMIGAIGIGYEYVKNEGYSGLPAGIIALCTYLIMQPASVAANDGNATAVILKEWTGGKGMVAAILCGLLTGWIYSIFMKRKIVIRMPEGVPEGVVSSFTALIPGAVIISGATMIYGVFKIGFGMTPIEWIYQVLQSPLQGLTDSIGSVIVMGIAIPFFWFFGIHGSTIIGNAVMGPMLLANSADNQAILDAGLELTIANGGHIVTKQFLDQFMTVTGSGVTIGLVIYMIFFAKSSYIKAIEKAREGSYDAAALLVAEGDELFKSAHAPHSELLWKEAAGEGFSMPLLLIHAEDQMMSVETMKVLAQEMIELYRRIDK